MTAYDRKAQHVEPNQIAGADLPRFMRTTSPRGVNAADRLACFCAGVVVAVLYLNWPAIAPGVGL